MKMKTSNDWLAHQTDINGRMRQILVSWLWEVNEAFKLETRTFFLGVAYLDRYLATTTITRARLQLLGMTALFVASKVEEVYAPMIRDFVYISDKAYNEAQVIAMEKDLLQVLDFELCVNVFEGTKPYEVCAAVLLSVHDNMTTLIAPSRRNRMIRGIARCLRNGPLARRGRARDVVKLMDDDRLDMRGLRKLLDRASQT